MQTKFLKGLKYGSILLLAGILIVLLILYYIFIPEGQLRLVYSKSVADPEAQSLLTSILAQASIAISQTTEYHATISFLDEGKMPDVVPGLPNPIEPQLEDVLLNALFTVQTTGDFQVLGQVDVRTLMQKLYFWADQQDYFLIVTKFEHKSCQGNSNVSTGPAKSCIQIYGWLDDLDRRGFIVTGSSDEVSRDLALYLYREFVADADTKGSGRSGVPANELPKSFEGFRLTSEAYTYLLRAKRHRQCINVSWRKCLSYAHTVLRSVVNLRPDENNSQPSFALGLVLLAQTMDSARRQEHIAVVEKLFNESGLNISAAQLESSFIRTIFSSGTWRDVFPLLEPYLRDLPKDFPEKYQDYICANAAYRTADYAGQLNRLKNLDGFPDYFKPYLDGYKFEAIMNLESNPDKAREHLRELYSLTQTVNSSWIYNLIFASQACKWNMFESEADSAFEDAKHAAIDRGDKVNFLDAEIWEAQCLALRGDLQDAMRQIDEVRDQLVELIGKKKDVTTLFVDLGYYYATIEDYQSAAEMFQAVVQLRFVLTRIMRDPALKNFRSTKYFADVYEKSFVVREQDSVAEECEANSR